jgi:hypothetical protein
VTAKLKLVNEQIAGTPPCLAYLYPQLVVASSRRQRHPINGLNSMFHAYDIVKR